MLYAWNATKKSRQANQDAKHVAGMGQAPKRESRARSAETLADGALGAGSDGLKALPGHHMVRCFGLFCGDIAQSAIGKSLIGYDLLRCTFSNRHYVKSKSGHGPAPEANRPTPHGGAERSHPSPLVQSRSRTP